MRASGEGERDSGEGPGVAQQIRRLTGYCTFNIPINFKLNALLYSGCGFNISSNVRRRRLQSFSLLVPLHSFYVFTSLPRNRPERLRRRRVFINALSPPADVSADASQLPQRLFGFAGLIPDGFESRVIRLSPKGQRACQVSPHISVVLLTP